MVTGNPKPLIFPLKVADFEYFGVTMCHPFQEKHHLGWHLEMHFFDISSSKSGPQLVCFVHFDLEMCFAPQRRALFRHLNFQKWSETASF